MRRRSKNHQFGDLLAIPGIGPRLAQDLLALGIRSQAALRGRDAEQLYERLVRMRGPTDRCVLYTFRCAVYFCTAKRRDPELLKWWNWKER
jgi:hypothetical protein